MACPIEQSLNAHLSNLDEQDAKEQAIEMLAERMSAACTGAIGRVISASCYDFDYKTLINATNGSDEFNEMFYKVAEKLINSEGR